MGEPVRRSGRVHREYARVRPGSTRLYAARPERLGRGANGKWRANHDPRAPALPASVFSGRFELPVFVIQGDEDFTTPTTAASAFVDRIDAPQKSFTTIKGGHFAVFMNSTSFVQEMTGLLASVRAQGEAAKTRLGVQDGHVCENLAQFVAFHHFDLEQPARDRLELVAVVGQDLPRRCRARRSGCA